ncbi:ArsR family transcriptional regulator [Actinobacteria bacterium YIM 96077]|uniref:Transcriptional regulator n=1 Tax=Phytoactinopolyspora halophila TaxID=1981511 RepID=A0A329QSK8_9ACTN|nr:metalloregulator ArsR/SmtB family transcription factor [Phytoactinopolyspora halophila]AYY14906.1 ArsR family transcriptional regulator [Actinobacteria bacterium YIM 96077]RAW15364.1 transcriptional regulator [Phytoactinopolyspora halophila]
MSIHDGATDPASCCEPEHTSPDTAADRVSCCGAEPAPLGAEDAVEQAALFKALADPVRLQLLALIAANSKDGICVCDLVASFQLRQPTISHHLKVLREAGLIDGERRGTWVYYWTRPAAVAAARRTLDMVDAPAVVGAS